jgi:hypothetical protein
MREVPRESKSSGEQTASGIVLNDTGWITGIEIITDGTNDGKAIVYDNTSAAAPVICEITVVGTDHYGGRNWIPPCRMKNGIYVAVTGTGASYVVDFMEE